MKSSRMILINLFFVLTLSAFGQETIQSSSSPLENKIEVKAEAKNSRVVREVFDAAKYPALAAVGRINFIGRSWCSVILVAENIAVTAGHCVLEANYRFDLKKDFEPHYTNIIFKPDGVNPIEGVSVKRVLKAKSEPDYAILELNTKIPESTIKPLKVSRLTLDEMRAGETRLGCAGFNGDRGLGGGGYTMTVSRNIKLFPETSSKWRVDASCFSSYGGSGGLFFRENLNVETNQSEYDFLGVIWGLTDEKFNEKGESIKIEEVITSITPVSVFERELNEIINKNRNTEKWQKRN